MMRVKKFKIAKEQEADAKKIKNAQREVIKDLTLTLEGIELVIPDNYGNNTFYQIVTDLKEEAKLLSIDIDNNILAMAIGTYEEYKMVSIRKILDKYAQNIYRFVPENEKKFNVKVRNDLSRLLKEISDFNTKSKNN